MVSTRLAIGKISKKPKNNAIKSIATNPLPKQAFIKPNITSQTSPTNPKLIPLKIPRQSTVTTLNTNNSFKIRRA